MGFLSDSLLLDVGTLLTCILAVVYIYFKWSFTYWKKHNVPYIEPSFPFGNFIDMVFMRKPIGDVCIDIYNKLEGHKFGGMYIFTSPRFVVRDPDLIKDVLVKDFSTFHDRGLYMNEENEPLSAHLFLLCGMKWRNLRVKLTPTFTSGKMKMMFQKLVDCGKGLQTCLEKVGETGDVIEIKDVLARFSTDIISSCAFGIDCNCLKNEDAEFRKWGRKIFEPSLKQLVIGILSGIAPVVLDVLKLSNLDSDVTKYFRNMVEETVEYREKNNVKRNDFLQMLIQLKNKGLLDDEEKTEDQNNETNKNTETAEGMSMNCVAAQAFVFFIAGFETSSTTMTFCLYELSINPDIQEVLRNEIDTVLEKHDGNISYEAIQEMTYLDKVVAETLRKHPPIPMLNRECSKPYKIPGTDTVLEKGTRVLIPVTPLHHDPMYYPEPDRFDPERFSEEEKQKRHHYVYLPFGEGPRICIGMRFGLMQTKVGLVSLLSKYEISVSEKTPIPLAIDAKSFILAPLGHTTLSAKELAAQAFMFFAAGFEPSATTMSFCLYELALNPDIQDRLRNEIDTVLKKHGGSVTYEGIQEMSYLDKTISETLRKYPPLPILNRECTKRYEIPGTNVILEKGIQVVIPTMGMHYDPQYFPEPEKFDPERFSEETKSKRHHYVYLPFGEGPRICIGMKFGLLQTKIGLVFALSKYQFHICKETAVPLIFDPKSFILTPVGGINLQIKNRTKRSG